MFAECSSLKELNLNNFNINNVTDMSFMFNGCSDDLKMKIKSENKNIKDEAFY
jgi:surface protein